MIKCPYCHSSNSAVLYEKNSKNSRFVSYRRHRQEVWREINERLCVDCGGIFVAKKDCNKIKASMERALEYTENAMRGVTHE